MRLIALFAGILFAAATAARAEDAKIPSDEEVTKKIVGKWTAEMSKEGATATLLTTFKKDNTFDGAAKIKIGDQSFELTVTGTWKVEKGELVEVITKASAGGPKPGTKSTDKILAFGDKEFKLKNERGEEEVFKRAKE